MYVLSTKNGAVGGWLKEILNKIRKNQKYKEKKKEKECTNLWSVK